MRDLRDQALDEMLVIRCQEGDVEAFEQIVRRWQRRLWRHAFRLTGSDEAAWDVVQETWIAVLKGIRRLNDPAIFVTWAYRIVRNKSADYCRRNSRRRHLIEKVADRHRTNEPDRNSNSDHEQAVGVAMRRMSVDKRELLTLRYREEFSVTEIARLLDVPVGTVKSRLYHAREELKRSLKGEQQ